MDSTARFERSPKEGEVRCCNEAELGLEREGESDPEDRGGVPPSLASPERPPDRGVSPTFARSPVDDGDDPADGDCEDGEGLAKLASDLRGVLL